MLIESLYVKTVIEIAMFVCNLRETVGKAHFELNPS